MQVEISLSFYFISFHFKPKKSPRSLVTWQTNRLRRYKSKTPSLIRNFTICCKKEYIYQLALIWKQRVQFNDKNRYKPLQQSSLSSRCPIFIPFFLSPRKNKGAYKRGRKKRLIFFFLLLAVKEGIGEGLGVSDWLFYYWSGCGIVTFSPPALSQSGYHGRPAGLLVLS